MSEDFVPEVNNTPDVEETKSPLKTVVENVSELAAKAPACSAILRTKATSAGVSV